MKLSTELLQMLFPPTMFVRVRTQYTIHMQTDYLIELLSPVWSFRIQKLKYYFIAAIIMYVSFLCTCIDYDSWSVRFRHSIGVKLCFLIYM